MPRSANVCPRNRVRYIALTTASLGFAFASESGGWMLWIGIGCLMLSVFSALWCALNRLWDFRETARIARGKMSDREKDIAQDKAKRYGHITWCLLYTQLSAFALGVLLLAVALWPT